mmetsp:Transcript_46046/g.121653  ORF Transcript_46046/g.121653 Transcript_46046/m.121653 type:complete len:209 (+) Transcript_46046:358-984(+)
MRRPMPKVPLGRLEPHGRPSRRQQCHGHALRERLREQRRTGPDQAASPSYSQGHEAGARREDLSSAALQVDPARGARLDPPRLRDCQRDEGAGLGDVHVRHHLLPLLHHHDGVPRARERPGGPPDPGVVRRPVLLHVHAHPAGDPRGLGVHHAAGGQGVRKHLDRVLHGIRDGDEPHHPQRGAGYAHRERHQPQRGGQRRPQRRSAFR